MRVLVTGGTGFIGSNLANYLIQAGNEVIITGQNKEQNVSECKCIKQDLSNVDWNYFGKFDVVFHQAALNNTTFLDKEEMFRVNVHASKALFDSVIKNGCKKIVYASSTAVYGNSPVPYKEDGLVNPLNPYAESKKALDELAIKYAQENPEVIIVGLRYCNVYGPGENHKEKRASMIFQLAQQIMQGNPKIFKYGEQKRDYIYVKDVVQANILAAQAKQSCIVNCGSGKATTFNDLITILNTILGTNNVSEYIDNPYLDKYQNHTECDMNLAKEKIGFTPQYDIKTGIEDYKKSGFLTDCYYFLRKRWLETN